MRRRLDAELVRRGLARSRQHAAELVAEGRVTVDAVTAAKPMTQVEPASAVVVRDVTPEDGWVGRGVGKLEGALDALAAAGGPVAVEGRYCLDAGASTGGFTQVLLQRGAERVLAVDVGYGQLAWQLRTDPRVVCLERTNVRDLVAGTVADRLGAPAGLVVADLSFISLGLVLPALRSAATEESDLLLLVKPQFEVGRERLGRGGVVRDPSHRVGAVLGVIEEAASLGLRLEGVTASPLPGPAGNVEYFVHLRQGVPTLRAECESAVEAAVAAGPVGASAS